MYMWPQMCPRDLAYLGALLLTTEGPPTPPSFSACSSRVASGSGGGLSTARAHVFCCYCCLNEALAFCVRSIIVIF